MSQRVYVKETTLTTMDDDCCVGKVSRDDRSMTTDKPDDMPETSNVGEYIDI